MIKYLLKIFLFIVLLCTYSNAENKKELTKVDLKNIQRTDSRY
jgi:hypothetical protein